MGLINDILYTNKTGKLAVKAMDIYSKKALLINSNIANAETPGYKALEMKPFEKALKDAYRPGGAMSVTNAMHLKAGSSLKSFQPEIVHSTEPGRIDGNNVNLDSEVAKMTQNEIMYRTVISALKKRGKMISSSIDQTR